MTSASDFNGDVVPVEMTIGYVVAVPIQEGLRWAFHFLNNELIRIEIQSFDNREQRWARGMFNMTRAFYSQENDGLKPGDIVAISFTEKRKLLIVVRDEALEKIKQNRMRAKVPEEDALAGRFPGPTLTTNF